MMRKRDASLMLAGLVGSIVRSGCGAPSPTASTLPDGDYTGQSEAESDGSYGVVNFTVVNGAVTAADFVVYDADGNGRGAATQFATQAKGLALTNLDVVVI